MAAFLTNIFGGGQPIDAKGDPAARAEAIQGDGAPGVDDDGGGASGGRLDGAFEQEQVQDCAVAPAQQQPEVVEIG